MEFKIKVVLLSLFTSFAAIAAHGADYALGDRLVAPTELGTIDWPATYQASVANNPENTLFLAGTGDSAAIYFARGGNPVKVNWIDKNATTNVRDYVVSETATKRPYRLFRTDAPYNSEPVSLDGQFVKIVGDPALTNGVYLSSDNKLYCVGDVKGQLLLVYYNSGDFTDVRKVQVIEACTPSVTRASAVVGQRLLPVAEGYDAEGLYPSVVASSRKTYDGRGDFIYVHEGEESYSPNRNAAFAIRPTMDADGTQDRPWDATINWYAPDEMGVRWPFEQTQYSIAWGDDGVKLLVSDDSNHPGQSPIFPEGWKVTCGYQSPDGHLTGDLVWRGAGKSLLKIEGTDTNGLKNVTFLTVNAVAYTDVEGIVSSRDVGVAVTPSDPAAVCVTNASGCTYLGYIHQPASITCYDPETYVAPASAMTRSDIFFVNLPEGDVNATLDVWWNAAVKAGDLVGEAYFPSIRECVRATFPNEDTTEQIVLASTKGSAGVSELKRVVTNDTVVTTNVYWHTNAVIASSSVPRVYAGGAAAKDGTGIGWNPNVAHAWCETVDGGYVCWALRNDMVTHSLLKHPLVYVKGTEKDELGFERPRVWTYYVLSTNEAHPAFAADTLVGERLPGPHPLDLAQNPYLPEIWWKTPSDCSKLVAYRDCTGAVWARRDGTLEIFMYYANRSEFKFTTLKDGVPVEWATEIPSGTPLPWNCALTENDGVKQTVAPGAWTWTAAWPSDAPTMQIGRTLTKATDGLAGVWQAASAAVVWPDPTGIGVGTAASANDVAQLVDPICKRTASLAGVGVDRANLLSALGLSAGRDGNLISRDDVYYFANVPASLSRRVWYDPNAAVTNCLVVQGLLDDTGILHMNVLNAAERQMLKDIVPDSNAYKSVWDEAISSLASSPIRPNAHSYVSSTAQGGQTFTEFKTAYSSADHYALATLGSSDPSVDGTNWVVWIENEAAEGKAVAMHVMRVVPELYVGSSVTRTDDNNLLSPYTDVIYTEPFGGAPEDFYFQWQQAKPPADGAEPSEGDWGDAGRSGNGLVRITLGTQGNLADLVDRYYRVRYRPLAGTPAAETLGTGWSEWTSPCLAEGWIKRVMSSIAPFTQRVTDLYENSTADTVSMLSQIGGPYQGDIALNADNMDAVGLLETYVTLLNKAESMSIAMGDSSVDFEIINKQLLQIAERLDDFYALLGNEAYSDAANPTIAYGSADDYGQICSGLFSFDNQVPTLLDEELSLLRGRGVIEDELEGDDVTAYRQAPVYNRLLWNYSGSEGEVAYALNYNMAAEADYPQGHGDAWGHYLSGLKLWYRLLRNPSFSWSVSIGEMSVGDQTASADYFEEEKLIEAAASLGKTAERIVDLSARKVWRDRVGAPSAADAGYEDNVRSRAFGYGEWGNRGGVATFVNWMVGNSLLPAAETNGTGYTDQGLLKINRSTAGGLDDLVDRYALIQRKMDRLNDNRNPLGLSDDAVPFGISTAASDGSESHFEQTLALAKTALKNANALLEKAGESTALLRALGDSSQDAAAEEEAECERKLIAYYGYPYSGDMGAGKTYAKDYDGPDYDHWAYVENVPESLERFGIVIKPESVTGTRRAYGALQAAYREYVSAVSAFDAACLGGNADEVKLQETVEATTWMSNYLVDSASSGGSDWTETCQKAKNGLESETILAAFDAVGAAGEKVLTLKAEAEAVRDALASVRQKQTRAVAKSRYQDAAHRIWRDEALDVYAHSFDLAQKYTWLAAKAYDYETGGEITAGSPGSDFLNAIVGTRLPGELTADGDPMLWGGAGDAGLSDILAQLEENWEVQKGALGINNPQDEVTWFSLRTEAFRILPGADGLNTWRNKLDTFRVSNLRNLSAYTRLCKDLSSDALDEPALVIPLTTTIEVGKNFFGHDLAGGDHQFTTTHYATKIAEAGVQFVNYNVDKDGGTAQVFAADPYVYLIPVGSDKMRAPATGETLEFNVVDQLLEVPNLLGSKALAQNWSVIYAGLSAMDGTVSVRKYPAFRATGESTSTTLIGRSVWNTQWVLVIPASSLRSDRAKALDEFVWGNDNTYGVTDIRIGFKTYSHWGE